MFFPVCRFTLLLGSVVALAACRTRPWELTPPADLAVVPPDFSTPPDLYVPPDFTPPPDLVPPFFCRPIYVVDGQTQMLSGFDPLTDQISDVDILRCPGTGRATPDTMSIDLDGNAWVFYMTGALYKVDLRTARCTPTAFDATHINPDPMNLQTFGSSFSLDAPGGTKETLYVSLGRDLVLAAIDPVSLTFKTGPSIPNEVELTGTAAAELWLYAPGANPTYIARVDKTTGKLDSRIEVPQITIRGDFAFAFWGGSFWIFNGDGTMNLDTTVYQVKKDTGQATTVLKNTGRHIVGAGVSGCAPLGLDR